ncbi:MAG: virulence protein RhuM/Fic/DOC family protein [Bacteroidetes bacterium]|nr:virulence protein RhuM/Fic/DOC family protein [Bacteroidota bacterium]
MESKSEIVIYKSGNGQTSIDVRLEQETVWLTQEQISALFERERSVITKHINNIFKEKELDMKSVCANFAHTAEDGKTYQTQFYNLDVIISTGYRVKSKRGTQFRIWANRILKDYLVKGYSVNEKRLKDTTAKLNELKSAVKLLGSVIHSKEITTDEAKGLITVIADFTFALDVLDKYDHEQLTISGTEKKEKFRIDYSWAVKAIDTLRKKFKSSSLFGKEKDESFKSSLNTIYQTFDKKELYPSVEEKAAHLLYFVVKNHSFVDGNKRIAAFLFVWFMERNGLLYRKDGTKRIADNALVALTLLIAQSKPEEKDMMIKVIVNLINNKN